MCTRRASRHGSRATPIRLKLVGGAYWFSENSNFNQQVYQGVRVGPTTGLSNIYTPYHAPTDAAAVFADANVSLTSRFRVLGGIRYTDEKRGLYGTSTTFSTVPTVPLCAGRHEPSGSRVPILSRQPVPITRSAMTPSPGAGASSSMWRQDSMAYRDGRHAASSRAVSIRGSRRTTPISRNT